MDEAIRLAKERAYHKGYIDGYRRGVEDGKAGKADIQNEQELLNCPVQFLNLSTRSINCLDRAGYHTIRDIIYLNRQEIWKIRNLGRKGLHEIAVALWDQGIRDSVWDEWRYSD